jgi:uncharacterized protein
MDAEAAIKQISDYLGELSDDTSVPRNIRRGAQEAASQWLMNRSKAVDVRVFSAIKILDDLADDPNIPMHARTMIYNIITQLEMVNREMDEKSK